MASSSGKKPSKAAPRTVALVYRSHTASAVKATTALASWLRRQGHRAFIAPGQQPVPSAPTLKDGFDQVDLVVVFGGDGTYLRAVRYLEGRRIPILGFNMGSLGFLTVHPAEDARSLVERTLSEKMSLQPRSMIHAQVRRGKRVRDEFHALNDVVLERGSYSHLINAAIFLGARKVGEVKADGFIVSSPTGSTAYNLAAGGPILDPSVNAFTITPVAPHALTTRPLIVPDETQIILRLVPGREQKAHFIVDGQKTLEVSSDDEVILQRSQYDHWVVREPKFNHFDLLKEKLKFGERA